MVTLNRDVEIDLHGSDFTDGELEELFKQKNGRGRASRGYIKDDLFQRIQSCLSKHDQDLSIKFELFCRDILDDT